MHEAARAKDLAVGALLVLAVAAVYAPVRTHGFVSFDDPGYVASNARVLAGWTAENVVWALSTFHFANWHPLTWLSYMAEVTLFGPDPGAMHVTNAVLHAANALLVFGLLRSLSGERWPSALAAALFAVHPLHVESVAWIAQRKDVLSTCLGLLSLLAYVRFARRGSRLAYLASVGALGLGLMAKPMLVTWPVVLLLLDAWPLRRLPRPTTREARRVLARRLAEKLPFAALALATSALTLAAQAGSRAIAGLEHVALDARMANAGIAYASYLLKLVWPVDLAPLYPHPGNAASRLLGAAGLLAVALLTVLALRAGRRRPAVAVGWLWFLVTLAPVMGLVQVGDQAFADRYTYVPALGLYGAVAWGLRDLVTSFPRGRVAAATGAAAASIALAGVASGQVRHWQDSLTLFEHTLDATRANTVAHTHYGNALLASGRFAEAIDHYQAANALHPGLAWNHVGLGNALLQLRRFGEARRAFASALAVDPDSPDAHIGMGNAYLAEREARAAFDSFRRAVELAPDSAEAHNNAGAALGAMGDLERAIGYFEAALQRRPGFAEAAANLARARQGLAATSGSRRPGAD